MELTVTRETLLPPLQIVASVVERKQTLAVLANVLFVVEENQLSITGTDCEIELIARIPLVEAAEPTKFTIPARKLMDICRALPDDSTIKIKLDNNKATVCSGKSRFSLATLPADNFPAVNAGANHVEYAMPQGRLKVLLERTYFCMAQQDVRYFLNGLLLDYRDSTLFAVATNGHRLAMSYLNDANKLEQPMQCIMPRKAVLECIKLLADDDDAMVNIALGQNHIRLDFENITFTSKLIDGRFPDYNRVIPKSADKVIMLDRDELKQVLARVAILANEKYHGVRLQLRANLLRFSTNNPEQEEAEEEIVIEYDGNDMDVGFNVTYLLDILNSLPIGAVRLAFTGENASVLIESQAVADDNCAYVVMPMRL